MTYKEYMALPFSEFSMKLNSIPENEPLYKRIKSRVINLNSIKNKEERKYWRELRRIYQIPNIYLGNNEIEDMLKANIKDLSILEGKNLDGKKFN